MAGEGEGAQPANGSGDIGLAQGSSAPGEGEGDGDGDGEAEASCTQSKGGPGGGGGRQRTGWLWVRRTCSVQAARSGFMGLRPHQVPGIPLLQRRTLLGCFCIDRRHHSILPTHTHSTVPTWAHSFQGNTSYGSLVRRTGLGLGSPGSSCRRRWARGSGWIRPPARGSASRRPSSCHQSWGRGCLLPMGLVRGCPLPKSLAMVSPPRWPPAGGVRQQQAPAGAAPQGSGGRAPFCGAA